MRTDNTLSDTNDKNYFLFSSIKNLTRINSDYLDNPKKTKFFATEKILKRKKKIIMKLLNVI
jgi:hypothetical protein